MEQKYKETIEKLKKQKVGLIVILKILKFPFRCYLTFIKGKTLVSRSLVEVFYPSGQSQQELESQLMGKNLNILPIEVLLWEEDSACVQVLLNLADVEWNQV